MIIQTINGAISSDYTLAIAFSIIGFLLVAIAGITGKYFIDTLNEIKRELKTHTEEINLIKVDNAVIKEGIKTFNNDFADEIVAKIRAITPNKY